MGCRYAIRADRARCLCRCSASLFRHCSHLLLPRRTAVDISPITREMSPRCSSISAAVAFELGEYMPMIARPSLRKHCICSIIIRQLASFPSVRTTVLESCHAFAQLGLSAMLTRPPDMTVHVLVCPCISKVLCRPHLVSVNTTISHPLISHN